MKQPTLGIPRLSRMRVATIGALVVGAVGVFALPSAQAAGGTATCQAAQAEIFLRAGDEGLVFAGVATDVVVAPDDNGTNTGGGELSLGDPALLQAIAAVLACEATRADEGLSAEGSVTDLFVTSVLGDLVSAELISSEVDCPADRSMPTTADTEVLGLAILGEPFTLETGEQINETFDFDIPGVFTGTVTVVAGSEADTTDDTASATGLVLSVTIDGTSPGIGDVDLEGSVEIRLAETSCERPDLIVQPTEPTAPPTEPTAPPTEPTAPPTEPTGPVVTLPPTR